jgi:hypothetical protein
VMAIAERIAGEVGVPWSFVNAPTGS